MILEALLTLAAVSGPAPAAPTRHLIYLHGRIVQEEQSVRPVSPRFGTY